MAGYQHTDMDGDKLAVFTATLPDIGKGINIKTTFHGVSYPLAQVGELLDAIREQAGAARGLVPYELPEYVPAAILAEHSIVDYEGGPEGAANLVAICMCGARTAPLETLDQADDALHAHVPGEYWAAKAAHDAEAERRSRQCTHCGSHGDWQETVFKSAGPGKVWVCALHGAI
jgi:hypothetical protein